MHRTESLLQLRMFSGSPTESIWSSVSGMCRGAPWGNERCPRPWHLKMPFFLCGFGGASWPWLQDHNRWPTGHPRRCLLVPSSCHICFTPRLWFPGDCFLTVPHSRHHGYTIPIAGEQTSVYTHAHTPVLKPSWSPKSPHSRHYKTTVGYYFISPTHTGNARQWVTAITFS